MFLGKLKSAHNLEIPVWILCLHNMFVMLDQSEYVREFLFWLFVLLKLLVSSDVYEHIDSAAHLSPQKVKLILSKFLAHTFWSCKHYYQ